MRAPRKESVSGPHNFGEPGAEAGGACGSYKVALLPPRSPHLSSLSDCYKMTTPARGRMLVVCCDGTNNSFGRTVRIVRGTGGGMN